MATHWYYQAFAYELGPVPFRRLAELVRNGEVLEDDLVRGETESAWRPARSVIGLFHIARRLNEAGEAGPADPESGAAVRTRRGDAVRGSRAPSTEQVHSAVVRSGSRGRGAGVAVRAVPPRGADVLRRAFRWGTSLTVGSVTALAIVGWSQSESLRFPVRSQSRLQPFPAVGHCPPMEYRLLLMDAALAAAAVGYVAARGLERLADD